jgi:hypothetical protein
MFRLALVLCVVIAIVLIAKSALTYVLQQRAGKRDAMIENALIWLGENVVAASAFGIAAIAVGLIIYLGHDLPAPPVDEDEHAKNRFI